MARYPVLKDLRLVEVSSLPSVGGGELTSLVGDTKIIHTFIRQELLNNPPLIMDDWSFDFLLKNYPGIGKNDWTALVSDKDKVMLWQRNIRFNVTQNVPNILGHISHFELKNEIVFVFGELIPDPAQDVFLLVAYF